MGRSSSKGAQVWSAVAALFLVFMSTRCRAAVSEDAQTLVQLKSHWNDGGKLSDWNLSSNFHAAPCTWTGVTCDELNRSVISLNLSSMNISGQIPSLIGNLRNLSLLTMSRNFLGGKFQLAILRISKLKILDLSNNQFVGSLPGEIYMLQELVSLNLGNNNFSGAIPPGFGMLSKIQELHLEGSYLTGTIPSFLGNLATLKVLALAYNSFNPGNIPDELGKLVHLETLWMTKCQLVGQIPKSLGNMVNLTSLDLSRNYLQGSIPKEIAKLSKLNYLYLYVNNLTGPLPLKIGGLRNLLELDVAQNNLSGSIPSSLADMVNLRILNLYMNTFSGHLPLTLGRLNNLSELRLFTNNLSGHLPTGLGVSQSLIVFDVSYNSLSGPLPQQNLCKGKKLEQFLVAGNKFTGTLPGFLGNCPSLYSMTAEKNQLTGQVPQGLWKSPILFELRLSTNSFHGQIPTALSPSLRILDISNNRFSGRIPSGLGSNSSLQKFLASGNLLSGPIPEQLTTVPNLTNLFLDHNQLSGKLPQLTKSWKALYQLDLSNNQFTGQIPVSLASLPALNSLDLSMNLLSGAIPAVLGNVRFTSLNLSGNHLEGPVPSELNNLAFATSFLGNQGLCGAGPLQLPACKTQAPHKSHMNKILIALSVLSILACISVLGLFFRVCRVIWQEKPEEDVWELTPYCKLDFTEDDIVTKLTEDNVIGVGATGKVYKVTLRNGTAVAVKKIYTRRQAQNHHYGESKEIVAELECCGTIKHGNIIKLLCCISGSDSKVLVYELMQNGSLYQCLHESHFQQNLSWERRYQIAMGVAKGLSYLHHDCSPPIIHRDVKSANILLDAEFQPRLADFGLARRLKHDLGAPDTMSKFAGSYGYISPEIAYTMKVNEKIDVYSFGVVLLELVTGRRPIDHEFGRDMNLVLWVKEQIRANKEKSLLDSRIPAQYIDKMMIMLKVGVLCTNEYPGMRPHMRQVAEMLMLCKPHWWASPSPSPSQSPSPSPYPYPYPSPSPSPHMEESHSVTVPLNSKLKRNRSALCTIARNAASSLENNNPTHLYHEV